MSKMNRPLRVLILDDDDKILRLLKVFLRQQGYTVVTAHNGREGLSHVMESSFDLIIVDVQMPVMDGIAFAEEVLRLWPWEHIVFCTGYMNDHVRAKARELGVRHILEKPLSFNTLEDTIQQVRNPEDPLRGGLPAGYSPEPGISCELSALREFSREALEHLHFGRTISGFADTLSHVIPCSAAGVFGVDGDYQTLCIQSGAPLDPAFQRDIIARMVDHFEVLSDSPLNAKPSPHVTVARKNAPPISRAGHDVLMVPVAGKQKLMGMLWVVLEGARTDTPPPERKHVLLASHHLTTLLETVEHMRSVSLRDPLTELFNRNALEDAVERAWALAEIHGDTVGVLVLDMDDFKAVNDACGFAAGDRLLRDVASLITERMASPAMVFRTGGDEFLALLPRVRESEVDPMARELLQRITALRPRKTDGELTISATVGIALGGKEHGVTSSAQLVECAEQALFAAKQRGGGSVSSWSKLRNAGELTYNRHPVLVVDDDPQVALLIKRMLNPNMYEVTGALSVAEAVSLLEKGQKFQVILTDLALPHQDGTEMMRLADEFDPDMVKVVISGNISRDSDKQLRQQGAFDIIQKPFDVTTVRSVLAKSIDKRSRTQRKDAKKISDRKK